MVTDAICPEWAMLSGPSPVLERRDVGQRDRRCRRPARRTSRGPRRRAARSARSPSPPSTRSSACRSSRPAAGCTRWPARSRSPTARRRAASARVAVDPARIRIGLRFEQVGRDAAQHRLGLELKEQLRRLGVQRRDVASAQRELVERLRRPAADADGRRVLKNTGSPGMPDMRRVSSCTIWSADGRWPDRLQRDIELRPGSSSLRQPPADDVNDDDVRVRLEPRHRDLLEADHLGERRALRRLRGPAQRPGVIGRKESLRDDLPEPRRQREDQQRKREHQRPALHHPREAALVRVQRRVEQRLR